MAVQLDRGELDRVNGVTARVDTRTKLTDTQNHEIQVTQTDKYLILRDLDTGQVSALDLTTLQVSAVMPTTPGFGVSVALFGETAFVIDSVQGQVRQLDPRNLSPDRRGHHAAQRHRRRWLRRQGHPVGRRADRGHRGRDHARRGDHFRPGANPTVVRTVTVSPPGHDLVLSASRRLAWPCSTTPTRY